MKNFKDLKQILDKICQNEILNLRNKYKEHKYLNYYIYKKSEKIFRKMAFPYLRFEILLQCLKDIKEYKEYYPDLNSDDKKRINYIFKRLQKICIHMNIALDEYNKMLSNIEKQI